MTRGELVAVKRLDGWKSIAAYFGRDRTTAMRWARERNLPVRRMPGGKQGSVFAFEHELAAWATRQDDLAEPPEAAAPSEPATPEPATPKLTPIAPPEEPTRRRRPPWLFAVAGAVALLLVAGLGWALLPRSSLPAPLPVAMPHDPAVARDYVAARDAWARRTPKDLATAIRLYQGVIRREPGFAPAHAGLAEAWLIVREYGEVDEPTAYRAARRHAEEALRLDPDLPAGHRALGFIDYWWGSRTPSALNRFRRAIALDPHDAQSHFWYANMLADIGRDAEAQREYDTARLLSPGSRVIEVEQACSHWQAGRDRLALQQLTALAARAPDDATVFNCLAWAHIGQGDIVGHAKAFATRARLRGEPQLLRVSAELDAAVRRDPATAVRVLIAEGRREIATGARKLRETPAFYASAMGDRAALVQLLTEASDQGETWYSAPLTRRIAARWPGDREVQRLLARVLPREEG
jgi:hypothetical protein